MNETKRLLDAAKTAMACNDSELAAQIQTGKSQLSEYRKGTRQIPDHQVVALAKIAGEDPARVLTAIRAEHAPPELAVVWKEIARRSSLLAATLAMLGHPMSPASCQHDRVPDWTCILCQLRRILRTLRVRHGWSN